MRDNRLSPWRSTLPRCENPPRPAPATRTLRCAMNREESSYERGAKFLRVIRLLDTLMTSQRGWTTAELAAELDDIDQRTVQRYLRDLATAGLVIDQDESHRYRISDKSRLPPMQFSKVEGAAVLIALRLLHQMRQTRDDALIGALARVAAAMRLDSITAYLGALQREAEERPEGGERQQVENVVVGCFVDRIPCEIDYVNAKGETSRRVVRTYFLEPRPESRTVYLLALDSRSTQRRWFRMDRITQARALPIEGMYTVPEDFDIGEATRSSWGIWQAGDTLEEVVLRFRPEIVARVRQSTWHPSAALTDLPDGGVEMRLRVASEVEMRPWVLGWGSLVEVLQPPSLREHVAASMREGARIYDAQVSAG